MRTSDTRATLASLRELCEAILRADDQALGLLGAEIVANRSCDWKLSSTMSDVAERLLRGLDKGRRIREIVEQDDASMKMERMYDNDGHGEVDDDC